MNSTLNSKLFNLSTHGMKPEVRVRLVEISDEFLDQIPEDLEFEVLDIRLVGSNAAFNYTDKSDLDIHLVVNLAEICKECPDVVQYLFNAEKQRFNMNYDITVKGIQAEIYVEDVRAGTMTNGIYSILSDKWIKFPEEPDEDEEDIDITKTDKYEEYVAYIEDTLESGTSEDIMNIINDLYLLRKESLETDGEKGEDNLLFKAIRNIGLLDKLKNTYYDVRSDELTLEGLNMKEETWG